MAFAARVNTLVFDENTQTWIDDGDVVVTKNSISLAKEPDSAPGKTAVRLNDGSTIRVNQTEQQILDFLNS